VSELDQFLFPLPYSRYILHVLADVSRSDVVCIGHRGERRSAAPHLPLEPLVEPLSTHICPPSPQHLSYLFGL